MQAHHVTLKCDMSKGYRCKRAADSLDIDVEKKSIHELKVTCDLTTPYNIGLILGASGSGKTTLAKSMFGEDVFRTLLDDQKPIIEQLPESFDYETCARILAGVGLTQVACWIRPVYTLSNGQKARAEAALLMCDERLTVIDEWTSVVDRSVGRVMSHCIQKHARTQNKQIILLSCHYDVIEWLNPDWVIDCNAQTYADRRSLCSSFRRSENLQFDVRAVGRETWRYFSKYHYLSEKLPGGLCYYFGLFHGDNQIGFICFANYVPRRKFEPMILHSNRVVIHPDYAGMGLGLLMVNECSSIMKKRDYRIMAKFSSVPMYKSRMKSPLWKLLDVKRQMGKMNVGGNMQRQSGYRENIKTYSFEYTG